jgi:recombination protein RecR
VAKTLGTNELDRLAHLLGKLPGLGPRSSGRVALHLLKQKESLMLPLASALADAARNVSPCEICGNLDSNNPCRICTEQGRDKSTCCVVKEVGDLWALERSGVYNGQYHVMGGLLSALDGIGPQELRCEDLVKRASDNTMKEIILAMDATVDGQTTAHYLVELLSESNVSVTWLARGVPVGGELGYLDDGTIAQALKARRSI